MITLPGIEDIKIIHESPHSIVYKGVLQENNKTIIIKELKSEFPPIESIAKFNGEFEITNQLDITSIRKSLKKLKVDKRHILLLEYIEGTSVQDLLKNSKLSIKEVLKISIEIAKSVGDLHINSIIHKDINPSNILIEENSGNIKIIDFGISTVIKKTKTKFESPEVLEGTLPYISPEQTGRMNRSIDYRTDIYSLGITLYQMLTGNLPFDGEDALELVHAHIAKTPNPPHKHNKEIPELLSHIVMKMLEKNPESRYQSAYGILSDLYKCLQQLNENGQLEPFELNIKQNIGFFKIPEKLYGRENEIEILLDSFNNVSKGKKELITVGGYSGVGKTSLVNEIHKPITEKKGFFISGKFDQFSRDIPYSAVIYALKELVIQLLSQSRGKLAESKNKILNAVGGNGKIVTEVLPNLEQIIGEQPEVVTLGPTETILRFQEVFQSFIRALSQKEHPLVVFIDDWQWADMSSINFLKILLADKDNQNLLVITAYRDNEVDNNHPFIQTLDELKRLNTTIREVILTPIYPFQVVNIVSDTLLCSNQESWKLAELISNKTQGNPFFIKQFFISLYQDKLIRFNTETQGWDWEIEKIEQTGFTDNVIDLMSGKIGKLKPTTQNVLKKAACIGNKFDLRILSRLIGKSLKDTLGDIWEAYDLGFIVCEKEIYHAIEENSSDIKVIFYFLHDRVQQAAYSLLTTTEKNKTNLNIGRVVHNYSTKEEIEDEIMDIVNYFNSGIDFLKEEEKKLLIQLNLKAGKKAKNATAYDAALRYYGIAQQLLGEKLWEKDYLNSFELFKLKGECEYLTGQFELSDKTLRVALNKAIDKYDKASIYIIRSAQLSGQGLYTIALTEAIEALKMFGVKLPGINESEAQLETIAKETELFNENIKNIEIHELSHLPVMEDDNMIICTQIMTMTLDSIVLCPFSNIYLPIFSTKLVNISFQHGISEFIPLGYLFFSTLQSRIRNYKEAYDFAILALEINDEFLPNDAFKCKVNHIFSFFRILNDPLNNQSFKNVFRLGLEFGDHIYAGFACNVAIRYSFPSSIKDALTQADDAYLFIKKVNYIPMLYHIDLCKGFAYALKGTTKSETSFSHGSFKENDYHDFYYDVSPMMYVFYLNYKIQILTFFEKFDQTLSIIEGEEIVENSGTPDMDISFKSEYCFFSGVALTNLISDAKDKDKFMSLVDKKLKELELLSNTNERNFGHFYYLLKAERSKLKGEVTSAIELYEKGIILAQKYGFTRDEAFGNELAARFYLEKNMTTFVRLYITQAHYCYKVWGALGLVNKLEKKYPQFINKSNLFQSSSALEHTVSTTTLTYSNQVMSGLDFQSIVKASQTISSEIKLEVLLEKMMKIAVENGGAQKGLLFLKENDNIRLQASYSIEDNSINVLQNTELDDDEKLPASIVYYVDSTRNNLVLNNALFEGQFTTSSYIKAFNVKSVLCTPIIKQGIIKAIVYLENNLIEGAFTRERIEIINLLSSQIAISIDNALTYNTLEQKVSERTKEVIEQKEEIFEQNKKLELQADKLKELDKIKSRFFSNISHEFRTPLSLIINPIEKMLGNESEGGYRKDFQTVLSNANRLLKLINQLLDISKIENDKIELKPELININEFLERMVFSFEVLTREKNISFSYIKDITQEKILLFLDYDSLEKIFYNLLSNATKFTSSGGKIELSLSTTDNMVTIKLKDYGIGIDKNQLPFIFDRFYQINSKEKAYQEGTGIGLALVKELVVLLGGEINVSSIKGKGTEFVINFSTIMDNEGTTISPRIELKNNVKFKNEVQQKNFEISFENPSFKKEGALSKNKEHTVLVVEDNKDLHDFICSELEHKYKIIKADNGQKGIDLAFKKIPDLVISDIMMPYKDGYELCSLLKEDVRTSHIPIILLTAKASFDSKIEGLESGADDYMNKPFSTKELVLKVKNLLRTQQKLKDRFNNNILLEAKDITPTNLDQLFMQKAMDIVDENIMNDHLDVELFCKEIGMSRSNLHRKLKTLTNQSATQFIRSIRLKKATELLKNRDKSIESVSYEVGFGNISYFYTCFKKQFGLSPSEYRSLN